MTANGTEGSQCKTLSEYSNMTPSERLRYQIKLVGAASQDRLRARNKDRSALNYTIAQWPSSQCYESNLIKSSFFSNLTQHLKLSDVHFLAE